MSRCRNEFSILKMIFPSVVDPSGIYMLQSIRNIFDELNVPFESVKLIKETFYTHNDLINAIQTEKKCPVLLVAKFNMNFNSVQIESVHAMVATGIKSEIIFQRGIPRREYFVQCKNTHRDNPAISGKLLIR